MVFDFNANLLLLQCGDVEANPGPPRRQPAANRGEPPKKEQPPSEMDKMGYLEHKVYSNIKLIFAYCTICQHCIKKGFLKRALNIKA